MRASALGGRGGGPCFLKTGFRRPLDLDGFGGLKVWMFFWGGIVWPCDGLVVGFPEFSLLF